MASRLTFPTAELLGFKRGKKGGFAFFSSSITKAVASSMDWTDIPECFTGGTLDGDLAATSVELVPKDEALARHKTDLATSRVYKFETVRRELEGKQGKGHRTELRFAVAFADPQGCRKLEQYMLSAGKCSVTISYEKAAQQADLPGVEADIGCIACNNSIPLIEGNPKKHVSGAKCTRPATQQELAVQ